MNTSNDSIIQERWWDGVALWYNQQDYLRAMDVWWEAVDGILDLKDDTTWSEQTPLNKQHEQLAPLLLFLAGCNLDAGQFRKARALLKTCLRVESSVRQRALNEYLSSLEEDLSITEPWIPAREVMQWAVSTWNNPVAHDKYQRAAFLYPSIPSQAVYSTQQQPSWCKVLEENWTMIRDDYEILCRSKAHWPAVGSGDHRDGAGAHDGSVVEGGEWREIVLFGSGAQPQLAPRTAQLVQQCVPDAVNLAQQGGGEVIFSQLKPHTRIKPHCGSTNLRLTAHLGLVIPKNCSIRIGDTTCHWREGKVLVFDDSFEHEVVNNSNETRAVLLLRFWHFNLPPSKRQEALRQTLQQKEEDKLRRYNPPLPTPNNVVEDRAMGRTRCKRCWQTGFETLRLGTDRHFVCSCGHGISE